MTELTQRTAATVKAVTAAGGALVEAGLAWATNDPVSSSLIGSLFAGVSEDALVRKLSKRERARVVTTLGAAKDEIHRRWTAGDDLRDDGFFVSNEEPGGDSFFEEIADGVIVASQREHQQRKLQHLGYLVASIAYESRVDRVTANWALRQASELSWTHYMLLALVDNAEFTLPEHDLGQRPTWQSHSTWEAFSELGERGRQLMHYDRSGEHSYPNFRDHPGKQKRSPSGQLLALLLRLDKIPRRDLDAVVATLHETAAPQ
ncbi:hypothetical protein AB0B31_11545 [Catellatospora citrea]|uniref:hypothetical protein n=1 Tax=Catellatospora citrea TaxID=53366 RepID=UPI0033ECE01E